MFLDIPFFHNNPGFTTDFFSKIQTMRDFLGTQFTIVAESTAAFRPPPQKQATKKTGTYNKQFEATESLTDFIGWHLRLHNIVLKLMEFADCEKNMQRSNTRQCQ